MNNIFTFSGLARYYVRFCFEIQLLVLPVSQIQKLLLFCKFCTAELLHMGCTVFACRRIGLSYFALRQVATSPKITAES